MLIDPSGLISNPDRLEEIERASLRMVVQGLLDYREQAIEIFRYESDLVADIGEDITREALDRMGMSTIDKRLFGKVDYKRARYLFHPEFALKQALFIDSKAEKVSGSGTATLQTSQTSMTIRQIRSGETIEVNGELPPVLDIRGEEFVTTTIFVKYNYIDVGDSNKLDSITVACLPNGFLQDRYNPSFEDTIWIAGRNAPSLGEAFRVRLSFSRLRSKAAWRVQKIPLPPHSFTWSS